MSDLITIVNPTNFHPFIEKARLKEILLVPKGYDIALANVADGKKDDHAANYGQLKKINANLQAQVDELTKLIKQIIKTIPPGINSTNTRLIDVGGVINGTNDTFVLSSKVLAGTAFVIVDGSPWLPSKYQITGTNLKLLDTDGLPTFSVLVYGVPIP